jgi:hypothetical protein
MSHSNRKVGAVSTKQRLYSSPEMATVFREWCDHERFLYNLSVEQFEFAARYGGFGIAGADYNFNLKKINKRWA